MSEFSITLLKINVLLCWFTCIVTQVMNFLILTVWMSNKIPTRAMQPNKTALDSELERVSSRLHPGATAWNSTIVRSENSVTPGRIRVTDRPEVPKVCMVESCFKLAWATEPQICKDIFLARPTNTKSVVRSAIREARGPGLPMRQKAIARMLCCLDLQQWFRTRRPEHDNSIQFAATFC